MGHSIRDIAAALGVPFHGDGSLRIRRAAEPADAGPDDLALAMSPRYASALGEGQARAAILWPGADWQTFGLSAAIEAPRARLALAQLTGALRDLPAPPPGIDPTAQVDPSASIAADASVGPFCVIGAGVVIGAGTRIDSHVTIAAGASIGAQGHLGAGVRIGQGVHIGARVVLHPNVVLGADGFSFVTSEPSNVERARETLGKGSVQPLADPAWHKIHSLGGVEIGDDVEIGANSTVDAGTIRATRVGDGTKIDNLVQVGHNVIVGRHCLLCAQAAVAGSAVIGDRVVLGGKSGVADNITLGDDVVLGGAAIALSNVPAGRVMMGYPATRMDLHIESYKALRRLPRLLRDLVARQGRVPNDDPND